MLWIVVLPQHILYPKNYIPHRYWLPEKRGVVAAKKMGEGCEIALAANGGYMILICTPELAKRTLRIKSF
jgi:hypothetical protein